MRKITTILSLFILCSCDHLGQDSSDAATQTAQDAKSVQGNITGNVMRVAGDLRDNVKQTNEHIRDWLITPLPSKEKQPMPARYCYKVLQDILCYRAPMQGWENKLVGYQGKDAAPPPAATMQLLPLRDNNVANTKPLNNAPVSKPVFVGIPSAIKEVKNTEVNAASIDSAHETLPDSPLSPQL